MAPRKQMMKTIPLKQPVQPLILERPAQTCLIIENKLLRHEKRLLGSGKRLFGLKNWRLWSLGNGPLTPGGLFGHHNRLDSCRIRVLRPGIELCNIVSLIALHKGVLWKVLNAHLKNSEGEEYGWC